MQAGPERAEKDREPLPPTRGSEPRQVSQGLWQDCPGVLQGTDQERKWGWDLRDRAKESCGEAAPTASPVCAEEGPEWTPRAGEASGVISQACWELGQRLQHRPLQLTPEDPPRWRFSSF